MLAESLSAGWRTSLASDTKHATFAPWLGRHAVPAVTVDGVAAVAVDDCAAAAVVAVDAVDAVVLGVVIVAALAVAIVLVLVLVQLFEWSVTISSWILSRLTRLLGRPISISDS